MDMENPTYVLTYMLQVKDKIKALKHDLKHDECLTENVKQKKRDWIETYSNLICSLERKYFELTNKLN